LAPPSPALQRALGTRVIKTVVWSDERRLGQPWFMNYNTKAATTDPSGPATIMARL